MKRKIVWAVGAVALLGLGWVGWTQFSKKEDQTPQGGVATAKKGDYRITVTEEGTFQARKSISLMVASQVFHQQMTITKLVEEGSTVAKDEVLMELDKGEIDRLISQAELELQAEKNNVVQATEDLRVQKEQNAFDLNKAKDDVASAERDLRKWEELELPKKVAEAKVVISDAEQTVRDNENEVLHMQKMFEKDFVAKAQVEKAKQALEKANKNLEFAKMSLRLLEDYDSPRDTARLKTGLEQQKIWFSGKLVATNAAINQRQAALLRAQTAERQKEDYLRRAKGSSSTAIRASAGGAARARR
jgi:multidrug efflux pump subunit AcrA (membrane-fusion protein)